MCRVLSAATLIVQLAFGSLTNLWGLFLCQLTDVEIYRYPAYVYNKSIVDINSSSGGWCFIKSLWHKHWIKGRPARGRATLREGRATRDNTTPTMATPCATESLFKKNGENIAHTTKKYKSEISECSTNISLAPLPIGHTVSSRLLTSRVNLTPVPSSYQLGAISREELKIFGGFSRNRNVELFPAILRPENLIGSNSGFLSHQKIGRL